jgi:hypothetical protein
MLGIGTTKQYFWVWSGWQFRGWNMKTIWLLLNNIGDSKMVRDRLIIEWCGTIFYPKQQSACSTGSKNNAFALPCLVVCMLQFQGCPSVF